MASSLARSAALLAVLLLLPLVIGDFWAFQLSLYFLYAVAALGVGLCWGQAGFLPLGQSLFLGLGAYLSGFALIHLSASVWLLPALAGAALIPCALAYAIGTAVFRGRTESGPFFALITLALALLAFQIANSWNSVTGGYNGLKGIPGLPGLGDITDGYYVAAIALAAAALFAGWLIDAPIGVLWRAIAENERLIAFLGFDTPHLKTICFAASGLLAGLAGALYAPQQGLVTPELCGFVVAADLVIWAAVGGRATVMGPILGSVLVGVLAAQLRDVIGYWEAVIAMIFIVVVLYAPGGLAGLAAPLLRLLERRRSRPTHAAPPRPLPLQSLAVALRDVSARAGDVRILDALTVAFDRPGILCLIGPNGAGKTSIFNVLTGELAASAGEIAIGRTPTPRPRPDAMARAGIGRKFQIPTVFPELSIGENLSAAVWGGRARLTGLFHPRLHRWTTAVGDELRARFPFLAESGRRSGALSHGQRQLLELAMALIGEPRLLLLDEPCAGLSHEETAEVMAVIRWAAARLPLRIVIIEHDMALVEALADHVYVLHQGRLLAHGSVAEIRRDPEVQRVYAGGRK